MEILVYMENVNEYQMLLIHVSIGFGGGPDKSNFSKATIKAESRNSKNLRNPTMAPH